MGTSTWKLTAKFFEASRPAVVSVQRIALTVAGSTGSVVLHW
jgi:hypothetical protein